MWMFRKARPSDLDFLVHIDLTNDGYASINEVVWTDKEKLEHRSKIHKFIVDPERVTIIAEHLSTGERIGLIMYSISNRDVEYPWKTIFHELDRSLFPEDGRFAEIFSLWVHPDFRRQGLATRLKIELENNVLPLGVSVIYTHTEERNGHVVELNKKLGYHEVRRGAIWDDTVRVSLLKHL